jgi:hypothetical protein
MDRGAEWNAPTLRVPRSTTLGLSAARRRNSFHSELRSNGTSNIGIASLRLAASDGRVWYPSISTSRAKGIPSRYVEK